MAWRPAYSLQTLKDQLDNTYPGWLFLGFLGDQAHASGPSDHNPNPAGVVCALDIGPGGGLDIHALADRIVAAPHPDLKYIISNRRIAEWQYGFQWRPYSGSDPHDTHIHVSVGRGDDGQSVQPYDDRVQWNIKEGEQPMSMSTQEATAILDAFFGRFTGRKIKQSELDEYVPVLMSGYPDKFFAKAVDFDEIKKNFGSGVQPTTLNPGVYEVKGV